MSRQSANVIRECLFDLGITIVYAALAGLAIVAIVASDDGPVSIVHAALYALLLPGAALALIVSEIGLRLIKERRSPEPVRVTHGRSSQEIGRSRS